MPVSTQPSNTKLWGLTLDWTCLNSAQNFDGPSNTDSYPIFSTNETEPV